MAEHVQEVVVQRSKGAHVRAERSGGVAADRRALELAAGQYGVVSRRQLQACGVTPSRVAHLLSSGWLRRLYRAVYAVGHTVLRPEGLRLAAVLACGDGAVLSHRSAAWHWGLINNGPTLVEVSVARGRGRGPRGIRVRSALLKGSDVAVNRGVPITTVSRTLVDLAGVASDRITLDAVDQAIRLGIYNQPSIADQFRRGHAGSTRLRTVLADRDPGRARTRSELERRCLELVSAAGLAAPEVNVWLPQYGCEVDLLWRGSRLIVELDGWAFHRSRGSFEEDRRRTVDLQSDGYTVLRFTWRQIDQRSQWVTSCLRKALQPAAKLAR